MAFAPCEPRRHDAPKAPSSETSSSGSRHPRPAGQAHGRQAGEAKHELERHTASGRSASGCARLIANVIAAEAFLAPRQVALAARSLVGELADRAQVLHRTPFSACCADMHGRGLGEGADHLAAGGGAKVARTDGVVGFTTRVGGKGQHVGRDIAALLGH